MRINSLVLATLIALLSLSAPAFAGTTLDITVPSTAMTHVEPRVDADEPYWQVTIAWEASSADAVVVWWDEDGRGDDERLGPFPVDSYGKGSIPLTFRTPVGAAYSDRQVVIQATDKDGTALDRDGEKTKTSPVQVKVTFRLLPYLDSVPIHRLIPIDWWPAIWLTSLFLLVLFLLRIRPRCLRISADNAVTGTVGVFTKHPIEYRGWKMLTHFTVDGLTPGSGITLTPNGVLQGIPSTPCDCHPVVTGRIFSGLRLFGHVIHGLPVTRTRLHVIVRPARATYPSDIKGVIGLPIKAVAPTCPFPVAEADSHPPLSPPGGATGSLPAGVVLHPASGVLLGTVDATATKGLYCIDAQLGDGNGNWTEWTTILIEVSDAPAKPTPPTPPLAAKWGIDKVKEKAGTSLTISLVVYNVPAGETVTVTGVPTDVDGLKWAWGTAPDTGELSGTLTAPGKFVVTAIVTPSGGGAAVTATLTIEVT